MPTRHQKHCPRKTRKNGTDSGAVSVVHGLMGCTHPTGTMVVQCLMGCTHPTVGMILVGWVQPIKQA
ncbi:MAG: hypothetical protein ACOH2K_12065 [Burkholderiaceae bacterium]